MSKELVLTCLLSIVTLTLFAQHAAADEMIEEIESYKKYSFIKTDNKEGLELMSDSTKEITEMVNYIRKNKNDLSGKVTENSRTKDYEIYRTYYFNKKAELFAIIDNMKAIHNSATKKLTYYFEDGQLAQVIDENKADVTSTINNKQLYDWIKRMFSEQMVIK